MIGLMKVDEEVEVDIIFEVATYLEELGGSVTNPTNVMLGYISS